MSDYSKLIKAPKAALAALMVLAPGPILAQGLPVMAPPSESAVARLKDQALMAEITYAQALVARLSADLAASEARGKWAVEKLWGAEAARLAPPEESK